MVSRLINLRYEILERVGEGDLFQVFKTRDKVLGRVTAVKTLQAAFASDGDVVSALRSATSSLFNLSHVHIARILDVSDDDNGPVIVVEFIRGINLKDRIRRISPFTLSVAVDFAIAIGEALHHAHSQGILHGDLRAQNVVVSPEGAVKVTDFGLTPVYEASEAARLAHLDRAAPYQAAEVAEGSRPSTAADTYALGVILFEMLTGALPYPGESAGLVHERHKHDPVPSPRTLNPGVPRSLEGIVMKALQKRPEDRYVTAADMLNDLKSVRDALRFGKPLSWSPMEVEPAATEPAQPVPKEYRLPLSTRPQVEAPEPILGGAARMSATSAADDRISPFLKLALGTVTVLLIVVLIVGAAIWMATFSKPPDQSFPNFVGMKMADAQAIADKADVHLVEHDEYNEKFEPGLIYRTDWPAGRPIRQHRSINVWVSKGSKMVWVPNMVKLYKDEAEKKLKENGLILGEVDRQFSTELPMDHVISQNPRAGKRVSRDVAINLQISDGPKPGDENPTPPTDQGNPGEGNQAGGTGIGDGAVTNPDTGEATDPLADEARPYNLRVTIKRDQRGLRRVRVEYDDARGSHTPIDEYHNEEDSASQRVEVYGRRLTVRVYYGEDATPVSEKTITLPRKR